MSSEASDVRWHRARERDSIHWGEGAERLVVKGIRRKRRPVDYIRVEKRNTIHTHVHKTTTTSEKGGIGDTREGKKCRKNHLDRAHSTAVEEKMTEWQNG